MVKTCPINLPPKPTRPSLKEVKAWREMKNFHAIANDAKDQVEEFASRMMAVDGQDGIDWNEDPNAVVVTNLRIPPGPRDLKGFGEMFYMDAELRGEKGERQMEGHRVSTFAPLGREEFALSEEGATTRYRPPGYVSDFVFDYKNGTITQLSPDA